jgi:hypothetical protein
MRRAFAPVDDLGDRCWAKMLMLVQSAISLALAMRVVVRAGNLLS